jgi:nucleoside-diphosphate-sugar epimerase
MKAFVTGGSGFIGQHVVRKLVEREYQVVALARSESSAAFLRELGAQPALGDINDVDSMREPMRGSDVVFHIAGWYKLDANGWMDAEKINVIGTRNVLNLAVDLSVPKIIYTSTVTVFGDTKGELVDESYHFNGPFLSVYDQSKWLAHYKVAIPLIEEGAPIIVVMPGGVYGPGDHSWIAEAMRLYYRGLPAITGPDTTLTYAHVEDVAEGHILAAERGRLGESYILAGPAVPLGEMVDFWSYLTGKSAPAVRVPSSALRPLAPVAGVAGSALPLPQLFTQEAIKTLGATYIARADKARKELGWQPRPLQAGMLETFEWIAETTPESTGMDEQQKKIVLAALVAIVLFLFVWLRSRPSGKGDQA